MADVLEKPLGLDEVRRGAAPSLRSDALGGNPGDRAGRDARPDLWKSSLDICDDLRLPRAAIGDGGATIESISLRLKPLESGEWDVLGDYVNILDGDEPPRNERTRAAPAEMPEHWDGAPPTATLLNASSR